jgi:hypothetical protein
LLGNEADEIERVREVERAQLARRGLCNEEVPMLDCAAEDRARVALGSQLNSDPGPERFVSGSLAL